MKRQPLLPGKSHGAPGGFTLIEVLLSLGLATLVLIALATAVDVHLRCLQVGRTHAEEAQLARALLFRIEDDLRNVAVINPVDASNIPSASASSTAGANASEGMADASSSSSSSSASTTTTEETEDEYVLGIYGGEDWMQVDVRRTPRLDQYEYETLSSGSETLLDRVSGIKTVSYSLAEGTGTTATSGEYLGGLKRRELDHAVTRWAEDSGSLASAEQEMEPIAPEVIDIEFRYYDGTQWIDNWDSTEMGGLPLAVHVSLAIIPRKQLSRFTRSWGDSAKDEESDVNYIYSLTIALPVAEGAQEETEEAASE